MTTFDTRNGHVTIDTATHKAVPKDNAASNLRYASPLENMHDQLRHGTHPNARKQDTCHRGHLLEGANVFMRRDRPGSRECRACRSITMAAWRERQAS